MRIGELAPDESGCTCRAWLVLTQVPIKLGSDVVGVGPFASQSTSKLFTLESIESHNHRIFGNITKVVPLPNK
jgi:hypothetical protein